MATSASQPYIARLGFQDPDRSKDRHGLACEYLFERLLDLEVAPFFRRYRMFLENERLPELEMEAQKADERNRLLGYRSYYDYRDAISDLRQLLSVASDEYVSSKIKDTYKASSCINVPIKPGYTVVGFADALVSWTTDSYERPWNEVHAALGEVKITRQPAEQVLQQINFYKSHLNSVKTTYILTDYDCSDLQRLTQGSDVKVYRLGQRFEQWLANRSTPTTPEL